jgi:hypothetical protein
MAVWTPDKSRAGPSVNDLDMHGAWGDTGRGSRLGRQGSKQWQQQNGLRGVQEGAWQRCCVCMRGRGRGLEGCCVAAWQLAGAVPHRARLVSLH